MIRSMFSAISGLRSHQSMMDVVSNNISPTTQQGKNLFFVIFIYSNTTHVFQKKDTILN